MTSFATGTTTANSSEQTLSTITDDGDFELRVDFVNGTALDVVLLVRVKARVDVGGATQALNTYTFTGGSAVTVGTSRYNNDEELVFSTEQTEGTPVTFDWQISRIPNLDSVIAELGVAAPTSTPSVRTGLMLLYMALRNRVDVDTTGTDALKIYNDAGTQITSKLITDDGSDYSEAEMT